MKGGMMEEYTQITLDQWMEWKEGIRRKLQETAGNFVYIGYCLRKLRDSGDLYEQEECEDIFEFAKKEYGLDKSTVSRFIAINEKYSEGGYSMELQEKYRGFGQSQLVEMLSLSEAECELITEQTTVKEIRELKKFAKEEQEFMNLPEEQNIPFPEEKGQEEQEVSFPEEKEQEVQEAGSAGEAVPAAGADDVQERTPLQECIIDFFRDKKDLLQAVDKAGTIKEASELIVPSGNRTHRKGSIFLLMYDYDRGVAYRKMGFPEAVKMSWDDFYDEIDKIFNLSGDGLESRWDYIYGQKAAPVACQPAEPIDVWDKEPEPESDQNEPESDQKEAEGVMETSESVRNEPESVPDPVATSQQPADEGKPIQLESRWSIGRMKTIQSRYDRMLQEAEQIRDKLGERNFAEARSLAEQLAMNAAKMLVEDREELAEALDQLLED